MMSDIDEVRRKFEQWAREHPMTDNHYGLRRIESGPYEGQYISNPVQFAWEGWIAALEKQRVPEGRDLLQHLERQRRFSESTFGPGPRTAGVLDHIRKELREIEGAPHDLEEWIDVALLALDGAWRTGASSETICNAIDDKMNKNERRDWPDWREVGQDKAIEHVRAAPEPDNGGDDEL